MGNKRYERQKQLKDSRRRHNRVLDALTKDIINQFEDAVIEYPPSCRELPDKPWSTENPNPWTDWAVKEEDREFYDGPPPTYHEARDMCSSCPLLEICGRYAELTGQTHGVWGGVRYHKGRKF